MEDPMNTYIFTQGDVDESVSIMRDVAQRLIDAGKPLWSLGELNRENLRNPPDEFIVMYDGEYNSIATLMLSFEDSFFWPDVPANSCGFIHKLAVRGQYAGKSLSKHLIRFAADLCKEKGLSHICLDCDFNRPRLCAFYESLGFILIEQKHLLTSKLGAIDVALFKLRL
ncbi:MAG: GNAT family N-acetyltransferase [Christensenellales bacterium]|jgi:GNAT superfamily N-acetyltransferase